MKGAESRYSRRVAARSQKAAARYGTPVYNQNRSYKVASFLALEEVPTHSDRHAFNICSKSASYKNPGLSKQ